ncbi:AAEL006192-PA [Aedes aegypti]|uniref:Odorant receptor n=1 Tax=Aedes aegypti TaxID=7159 RepID=Q177B6_AEDAE|nr:AAEL006192-PA [Aedes aegypti]
MFLAVQHFVITKYRAFNSSDNCFVLLMFCNRLVGFLINPDDAQDYLRPIKHLLLSFTVIYELFEVFTLIIAIQSTGIDGHIGSLYLLMSLQQNSPDIRRRKHIQTINWFMLMFLLQELIPMGVWTIKGHTGTPLAFYASDTIDKLNAVFYPITLFSLTLIFCYSLIVVSSIMSALTLEFRLLGTDFEHLFEQVGPLETSSNNDSEHNWKAVEYNFKLCVVRHQILLGSTLALRSLLKMYSLIQLLIYFLMVAIGAFLYVFTQVSFGFGVIFFAVCVVSVSVNLLLYGFLCDRLEDQVESVGYRLYSSGWTDKLICSIEHAQRYKNFRKMMLIVMERTQKSVEFTCGNVYVMSLLTCRHVLWFAYSVFTVLINFLE